MSNDEIVLKIPETQIGSRERALVPGLLDRYHPPLIRRDHPETALAVLQLGERRLCVQWQRYL